MHVHKIITNPHPFYVYIYIIAVNISLPRSFHTQDKTNNNKQNQPSNKQYIYITNKHKIIYIYSLWTIPLITVYISWYHHRIRVSKCIQWLRVFNEMRACLLYIYTWYMYIYIHAFCHSLLRYLAVFLPAFYLILHLHYLHLHIHQTHNKNQYLQI
jgi:hypothetical protein